tara:strand:+ start:6057 stop:6248 length:192 start_codon:yes stop_codon:yes gene_type:complete
VKNKPTRFENNGITWNVYVLAMNGNRTFKMFQDELGITSKEAAYAFNAIGLDGKNYIHGEVGV